MTEFHTFETAKAIHLHQDELLQDAAKFRMVHRTRANRLGWWQRTQMNVGSLLIAIGTKLQEPHRIATATEAQAP
jgi:hypothetical protein